MRLDFGIVSGKCCGFVCLFAEEWLGLGGLDMRLVWSGVCGVREGEGGL